LRMTARGTARRIVDGLRDLRFGTLGRDDGPPLRRPPARPWRDAKRCRPPTLALGRRIGARDLAAAKAQRTVAFVSGREGASPLGRAPFTDPLRVDVVGRRTVRKPDAFCSAARSRRPEDVSWAAAKGERCRSRRRLLDGQARWHGCTDDRHGEPVRATHRGPKRQRRHGPTGRGASRFALTHVGAKRGPGAKGRNRPVLGGIDPALRRPKGRTTGREHGFEGFALFPQPPAPSHPGLQTTLGARHRGRRPLSPPSLDPEPR